MTGTPAPSAPLALVADLGGTNTRVALARGTRVFPETVRKFRNADHPDIASVLRAFLADYDGEAPIAVCVAMAGPVHDGVGQLTNLNWTVEPQGLSQATGAQHVAVLNDLQAQGYALDHIADANLYQIIDAPASPPGQTQLVVGIGTGFNAATVFHTASGPVIPPSESGHALMPVQDTTDLDLMRHVEQAHGFAGVEDVLSGRGLERVYRFHATHEKPAADIMAACADGSDALAQRAVAHFVTLMGRVVGDLALIQLPFGGIYLIGGVARAMKPYLADYGFADAFGSKGRFSNYMGQFSVHLVEDDYAALTGCASFLVKETL